MTVSIAWWFVRNWKTLTYYLIMCSSFLLCARTFWCLFLFFLLPLFTDRFPFKSFFQKTIASLAIWISPGKCHLCKVSLSLQIKFYSFLLFFHVFYQLSQKGFHLYCMVCKFFSNLFPKHYFSHSIIGWFCWFWTVVHLFSLLSVIIFRCYCCW